MRGEDTMKLVELPVDVNLLADFFECDVRTIQNWVLKGMPKNKQGEYPLFACVKWKLDQDAREIEILKEGGGDETLREMRKRNVEMDLKIKEEKLKSIRGEKIDIEMVNVAWKNEMLLIKQMLNGMPGVAMIKLEGMETGEERRQVIQDLVDDMLNQLADLDPVADEKEIMENLDEYDIKMESKS